MNLDVVNLEDSLQRGMVSNWLRLDWWWWWCWGGDCPFRLVLIIFCLPLVIQRPGVLPVMKTLNQKVYI